MHEGQDAGQTSVQRIQVRQREQPGESQWRPIGHGSPRLRWQQVQLQQCGTAKPSGPHQSMVQDHTVPRDMDQISTSSGESEVHAASDAAKMGLHTKYVLEEIQAPEPETIPIYIDAGAAIGFITNTCSVGRMKHIDLRETWVEQLRKKGRIQWIKVPGTANRADTFTKILQGAEFARSTAGLMEPLPSQGGMLK